MAEEFIRHANKVIISKIIKTDNNLSKELAQEYIDKAKENNPYHENINSDNNKCWEGFTEEYVYSYKTKQVMLTINVFKTKIMILVLMSYLRTMFSFQKFSKTHLQ